MRTSCEDDVCQQLSRVIRGQTHQQRSHQGQAPGADNDKHAGALQNTLRNRCWTNALPHVAAVVVVVLVGVVVVVVLAGGGGCGGGGGGGGGGGVVVVVWWWWWRWWWRWWRWWRW
jgi:hypothetical protein